MTADTAPPGADVAPGPRHSRRAAAPATGQPGRRLRCPPLHRLRVAQPAAGPARRPAGVQPGPSCRLRGGRAPPAARAGVVSPASAQPAPDAEPPLPCERHSGHGVLVIERILRDRKGLWRQIMEERELGRLIRQLFTSSVVALAFYGAVLGASASFAQAVSSAVKLPVLFLVTLAICLPTLYLFNLVFGARLSLVQAIALVLVAVTVISALSLAFAPVSLFFLVTAPDYSFYKLLNVGILMLTGVVGLTVLLDGMRSLNRQATAGEARLRRRRWCLASRFRFARRRRRSSRSTWACCGSGCCCSASSARSSPGRCVRSSATQTRTSRSSAGSRAIST